MTADFEFTVEWMTRASVVRFDQPGDLSEGFFLWVTQSRDDRATPLLVDMPVTYSTVDPSAVIAAADPHAVQVQKPRTLKDWLEREGF